jgi:hypothetical protein
VRLRFCGVITILTGQAKYAVTLGQEPHEQSRSFFQHHHC